MTLSDCYWSTNVFPACAFPRSLCQHCSLLGVFWQHLHTRLQEIDPRRNKLARLHRNGSRHVKTDLRVDESLCSVWCCLAIFKTRKGFIIQCWDIQWCSLWNKATCVNAEACGNNWLYFRHLTENWMCKNYSQLINETFLHYYKCSRYVEIISQHPGPTWMSQGCWTEAGAD